MSSSPDGGSGTGHKYLDPLPLPPLLKRSELIDFIFRSPKLVQRLQAAGWIQPLPNLGTRESLFSRDAAYLALDRILKGERPPRLPSEPPLQPGEPDMDECPDLSDS